jgi:decaprenyl-phosphate phosphoribosyltransferase
VSATPAAVAVPLRRRGGLPVALVRAVRPRQWTKNLLVVAAPGAAGVLHHGAVAWRVGLAFAVFCALAGGTYLLNDVADRARDRLHPIKRLRPVASGALPAPVAVAAGLGLLVAGLGLAAAVRPALLAAAGGYVALTAAYTLVLKRIALVDIASVATAHVLRAVAGAAAAGVRPSPWFLLVVTFSSLLVVAGKRYAELRGGGEAAARTRAALAAYRPEYLRFVWTTAATVAITSYGLWTFGGHHADADPWAAISIVPFALGIMRYVMVVEAGGGEEPEQTLVRDRGMQLCLLAWALVFGLAVALR